MILVLASNSPRRKQLLSLGGWDFSVIAPQVDEQVLPGESPPDYVRRLAEKKARAAWQLLVGDGVLPRSFGFQKSKESPGGEKSRLEQAIILAADTTVACRDAASAADIILGKPADIAEAVGMLRQLRNQTHQVFTGLAVFRASDGALLTEVVATGVQMRNYSEAELQAYVATGDPFDKAGAYAIQHAEFRPVQNLQGCFANVMGLPVCHTARLLSQVACPPAADIVRGCQQALEFQCAVYSEMMAGGSRSVE